MKATATALVFKFCGRNPKIIKRWPSLVTTARRATQANPGNTRNKG
jgi:hypothetical protein